jgi:hypothetical protein
MKSNPNWLGTFAVLATIATVCALSSGAAGQKSVAPPSAADSQSAVKHQPLNIKTGLWETTSTLKMSGDMPVPADMLNKLTPDQRARFEERMKANADARAHTSTSRACVTRENLDKMDYGLGRPGCAYTIQTSTSTEAKGKYSCDENGGTVTGTVDVQALDQEHMIGSTHGTLNGSGHSMTINSTFNSKWVGSSCGDMK